MSFASPNLPSSRVAEADPIHLEILQPTVSGYIKWHLTDTDQFCKSNKYIIYSPQSLGESMVEQQSTIKQKEKTRTVLKVKGPRCHCVY